MKKDKNELTEKDLKQVTGGQQTCGGYASVEFSPFDGVNPSPTKSWFGTPYEADSEYGKIPGLIIIENEH